MKKIMLQDIVFNSQKRLDLIGLDFDNEDSSEIDILIIRNHSFELLIPLLNVYLDYIGFKANYNLSQYDDTLSSTYDTENYDLIIFYLDSNKYRNNELAIIIEFRILKIIEGFEGKSLLCLTRDLNFDFSIPYFVVEKELKTTVETIFDDRLGMLSGTPLTSIAISETARIIGFKYIPAIFSNSIKCIILDLDNTLYKGILGEDGVDGIVIDDGYIELQKYLLELSKSGILLAIVTKNELSDVEALFSNGNNLILKKENFVAIKSSWNLKSKSIIEIINLINIGAESVLFIDDNPGELFDAMSNVPKIKFILAADKGQDSLNILKKFPGIFNIYSNRENSIRNNDVLANIKRNELKISLDQTDYFNYLNMNFTFSINDPSHINRVEELNQKTNQFITGFKRFNKSNLNRILNEVNGFVMSVELDDMLSDSGIISACIGRLIDDVIMVDEIVISCRALGRSIEELIVNKTFDFLSQIYKTNLINISLIQGPRNTPAVEFFAKVFPELVNNTNPYFKKPMDLKVNITLRSFK